MKHQKSHCSFRLDERYEPFVSCFHLLPVKCIFLYTLGLKHLISPVDRRCCLATMMGEINTPRV